MIASILLLAWQPHLQTKLNVVLSLPTHLHEWVVNLIIFGISQWQPAEEHTLISSIIISTAWSLSVELVYYVLLAIGFAYSPRLLFGALMAGVAYAGFQLHHHHSLANLYFPYTSGIIPFSIGALLFHLKKHYLSNWHFSYMSGSVIAALCWIGISLNAKAELFPLYSMGFYVTVIFTSAATLALALIAPDATASKTATFDQQCANYSYPLFLVYFLAGNLLLLLLPEATKQNGAILPGGLAISFLLAFLSMLLLNGL